MSRIAIVGSGIAGLSAAYILGSRHEVSLFEAADRLGGHSNTVAVADPQAGELGIDTGFIVHNDRNYPNLTHLFGELGVETANTEMSFGVTDQRPDSPTHGFCYRATNPNTLFADRRNLLRRPMWRMLTDIVRFYRAAERFLADPDESMTIAEFLADGGYRTEFVELHLMPMGAAVWSVDPARFGAFPAAGLLRFLDHHGLLSLGDRPQWRTVVGGSRAYVDALAERLKESGGLIHTGSPVERVERLATGGARVTVRGTDAGTFDRVVMAVHADQALRIVAEPSERERRTLGAITYQPNWATLHSDTSLMPPRRRAWAAWNYHLRADRQAATLTYDLTELQGLPGARRYMVSLNSDSMIDESKVIASFRYEHPVFDHGATSAQAELRTFDPADTISYVGAWCGNGFHEDGIAAAVRLCRQLGVDWGPR